MKRINISTSAPDAPQLTAPEFNTSAEAYKAGFADRAQFVLTEHGYELQVWEDVRWKTVPFVTNPK